MARAIVLGEKHLILGFKGVGFEVVACKDGAALLHELGALSRDPEVALVIVTESMAEEAPQALDTFRERSKAILTVIPTHEGSKHTNFNEMKKAVEKSIGVDILGKD